MDNDENKTTYRKAAERKRKWLIFDANGKTLGRFASEVSKVLRGKHRPDFTPSVDLGDGVIIINADKIKVTGSKRATKIYRYHTGAMSGLREVPFETMIARSPRTVIERAVWGMMPKNRLSTHQMRRLRVFAGEAHNHHAQKPEKVGI
ncbi:MAG TPA: 50S ribosomal protein L13 [Chlamydiales bacterium]|nr:50S ribosomal protein L13 [Chlamydiales bacterium]